MCVLRAVLLFDVVCIRRLGSLCLGEFGICGVLCVVWCADIMAIW